MLKAWLYAAALGVAMMFCAGARADETVKLGVVGPMTGPYAVMGENWRQGIEAYMAQHGDSAGGRKIEVIYRDTGGDPGKAKQLVQELVVRDKVSFLGGFGLTPEAGAAAPIVNQAKIPSFLYHTSAPVSLTQSPYFVRMGQNIATNAEVGSAWALQHGKKRAYIAVADYAPGVTVLEAFKKHYTANGGEIVGEDKMPLNTVDFSAFAERIAAAKPDIVELFIPPGSPAVNFVKAVAARGVMKNTVVLGEGEAEDSDLHLFDDSVKGFHSVLYYASSSKTPENEAFVAALKAKAGPDVLPSVFTVGAYDAMGLIYKLLEAQAGQPLDTAKEMELLKGYSWTSPRGKVTLDAASRELIQDYVVREVQETPNGFRNVIIDTVPQINPATFGSSN